MKQFGESMSEQITVQLGAAQGWPRCESVRISNGLARTCWFPSEHDGPHWALDQQESIVSPIMWIGTD